MNTRIESYLRNSFILWLDQISIVHKSKRKWKSTQTSNTKGHLCAIMYTRSESKKIRPKRRRIAIHTHIFVYSNTIDVSLYTVINIWAASSYRLILLVKNVNIYKAQTYRLIKILRVIFLVCIHAYSRDRDVLRVWKKEKIRIKK